METTIRLAAARRKLTKTEISKEAQLNVRTVDKVFDDIPDGITVGSLRQLAAALGLILTVKFDEPADNGQA